jgi:hypothetical protein
MTDSFLLGTHPATELLAFPAADGHPIETGAIARLLASPQTSDFVRRRLAVAAGRDPVLAYHEAMTLAGMLEVLACEEAREWLLPAMTEALGQEPEAAFIAAVEIAEALKPAAMALKGIRDEDMGMHLPEPANSRGTPADRR